MSRTAESSPIMIEQGEKKQQKMSRKSSSLPTSTVEYLKNWMMSPEHIHHPYPTEQEKAEIMAETGIELKQLTNWFVNNRKRYWKPRVEAKLQQQEKKQQQKAAPAPTASTTPSGDRARHISLDLSQPSPPTSAKRIASNAPGGAGAPQSARLLEAINGSIQGLSRGGGSLVSKHDLAHHVSEESGSSLCDESDDESAGSLSFPSSAPSPRAGPIVDEVDEVNGVVVRREVLDVHILKPSSTSITALPSLNDVSVQANVQSDRLLGSFPNCQIAYTIPKEEINDRKMVQNRRDAEVKVMKKYCLKQYLSQKTKGGLLKPEKKATSPKRRRSRSEGARKSPITVLGVGRRPRAVSFPAKDQQGPASKRRRMSSCDVNGWRDACKNARNGFCDSLPSLEEASRMFGYLT